MKNAHNASRAVYSQQVELGKLMENFTAKIEGAIKSVRVRHSIQLWAILNGAGIRKRNISKGVTTV